jgi:hypothetical protein
MVPRSKRNKRRTLPGKAYRPIRWSLPEENPNLQSMASRRLPEFASLLGYTLLREKKGPAGAAREGKILVLSPGWKGCAGREDGGRPTTAL